MRQRALVRASVMAALADPTHGFNSCYADALQSGLYPGATVFELSFGVRSPNVLQSYLTSQEEVDLSRVLEKARGIKAALLVFTSRTSNDKLQKFRTFSGSVICHLHFYLRITIDETALMDTEDTADAIEDAITRVFCGVGRPDTWSAGVQFNNDLSCDRPPVRMVDGGFEQVVPFDLVFQVNL